MEVIIDGVTYVPKTEMAESGWPPTGGALFDYLCAHPGAKWLYKSDTESVVCVSLGMHENQLKSQTPCNQFLTNRNAFVRQADNWSLIAPPPQQPAKSDADLRGPEVWDALEPGAVFSCQDSQWLVLAKVGGHLLCAPPDNLNAVHMECRSDFEALPDRYRLIRRAPKKPLRERVTLGCRLRRPDGTVTKPVKTVDVNGCYGHWGNLIVSWADADGWEIVTETEEVQDVG